MSKWIRVVAAICVLGVVVLGISACGGGDDSSSTQAESTTEEGAGGGAADVAAAEKLLAPYVGKPSPFPVDEPLKEPVPPDTKLVYLQCASPVCQLQWPVFEAAAKALGADVSRIKAGASAQDVANAFDTAVVEDPSAVFVPAIEPSLYTKQLQELNDNGVVTASSGVVDPEEAGFAVATLSRPYVELVGELLAAKAVAEKGDEANIAFYAVPELSFVGVIQEAFEAKLTELCPECAVRYVDIPITTIGNSAPTRIVSDLQKEPDTNVVMYSTQEMGIGVPAALKSAGITGLLTFGFGPTPANLEYIQNGEETGGTGLDVPVNIWTLVDEIARTLVGQELSPAEATEEPPVPDLQFLGKEDITFDPSHGWTGYPDFEERFKKLWSGK